MTYDDFLNCILPDVLKTEVSLEKVQTDGHLFVLFIFDLPFLLVHSHSQDDVDRLRTCFQLADSDHDGFVSFSEYYFFSSLMSTEDALLQVRW
jgi:hypothetical protein